jgi:hypothetical protein
MSYVALLMSRTAYKVKAIEIYWFLSVRMFEYQIRLACTYQMNLMTEAKYITYVCLHVIFCNNKKEVILIF